MLKSKAGRSSTTVDRPKLDPQGKTHRAASSDPALVAPSFLCQRPIPSPNQTESSLRPVFNSVFQQNFPTVDVRGNDHRSCSKPVLALTSRTKRSSPELVVVVVHSGKKGENTTHII